VDVPVGGRVGDLHCLAGVEATSPHRRSRDAARGCFSDPRTKRGRPPPT